MNRREFLKSMLMMAGAHLLGLIRPCPRMAHLIITDPQGKIRRMIRPVHVFFGAGEQWYTDNFRVGEDPIWKRGALPSLYFVNRRLQQPLVLFFEERWA